MLINRTSLSQTVDAINAAHFDGRILGAAERGRAARWIAGRQGLPGAYGGTFAGFPAERSKGIVLFTGERIASASARHILGEEASRALRHLRVRDPNVTRALESPPSTPHGRTVAPAPPQRFAPREPESIRRRRLKCLMS